MKTILQKYFRVCPKTGELRGIKVLSGWSRLLFPIVGLLALLWILWRLIPKPSRVTYPCMRIAMPIASGFIVYILGLIASVSAFFKARKLFERSRYILAAGFVLIGILASFLMFHGSRDTAYANYTTVQHDPNLPIGEAKGLFPGRVVWVHDPDATNENCNPSAYRHGWFLNENNNQTVIDQMLSDALLAVTGQTNDSAAWDTIFSQFNSVRGKGAVSYADSEKIFIKINATSAWSGNFNSSDLSINNNANYGISETSPQLVLSVLRDLVDVVGVPQEKIYIGDPMKHIYKHCYDIWHTEFPNIHYMDHDSYAGREKFNKSDTISIYYSDRGAVLRTGSSSDASVGDPVTEDHLYTIFSEAEYMLNIPTLKAHKHAGITMFAKNHFGSQTRDNAYHLHGGLVAPEVNNPRRQGYGLYRVQVDLMGHKLLGQKNLIYILDALWAADYEIGPPRKWMMAPFNNDWFSSIFISFDPVAIESVGFDFLRTEYTTARGLRTYPQMEGVDDYLHQAADSVNWPVGVEYDPENDGILITSLGVHEHWNNAEEMKYSRNLGLGDGIELVTIDPASSFAIYNDLACIAGSFKLLQNAPNPFNAATRIRYVITYPARVELNIYNLQGKLIANLLNSRQEVGEYFSVWTGTMDNGQQASSGVYICELCTEANQQTTHESRKMLLVK